MKNPAGLAYSKETGVDMYGAFTTMLVTGRENRYEDEFHQARKKGAEILAYLNPTDMPIRFTGSLDAGWYKSAKLWRYKDANGAQRCSYYDPDMKQYCPIIDLYPGSDTILRFVDYIANLMIERRVDGVFLDCVGEHAWNKKFGWDSATSTWNWPVWEQNLWIMGNIDIVQRCRAAVDELNPGFIIMNNNSWGDGWARRGEEFVNGRCIEHHAPNAYQLKQAQRPYGVPNKRRVLVLCKTQTDADAWLATPDPSVTHICVDNGDYSKVGPLACPPVNINPAPP
jgi:hypothetical protein